MIYAIGDIHANIRQLERLLDVLNLQTRDTLIFLGDYLDKQPYTAETLALLQAVNAEYKCIFLRGNHDFVWDRYLHNGEIARQEFLLQYGGRETLRPYGDKTTEGVELRVAKDPNFRPTTLRVKMSKKLRKKNYKWYSDLMERCWQHDPKARKDFDDILRILMEKKRLLK